MEDAIALQQAGIGLLVLEMVPATLAERVTSSLAIPTIGIGAGADCDGQVLVLHDMLGVYPGRTPRFARNFLDGAASIQVALAAYVRAVKDGAFPASEHSF
jgi:3-methyl-2-oxobutanoate hydroxymethyltransferase